MTNTRARERGISRRSWLLAGLTGSLFPARAADSFNVRYDGDTLRVAVPALHFLGGNLKDNKALQKLHDGAAVAYVAQLDLLNEERVPIRQQRARYVLSYALWEEKYSVTQLGRERRTVEGLSAGAAEAWCLENLALSTLGVPAERYFWLRFEMRTGGPSDFDPELDKGVGLDWLIKVFGRRKTDEMHWGPLEMRVRLADLPRLRGRGSRG